MNPGNSNQQGQQQHQQQQWQQQQQQQLQAHQQQERDQQQQYQLPNGQLPEQTVIELAQELVQKQHKLNKLMTKSAEKRTTNAQLQIHLLAIKEK